MKIKQAELIDDLIERTKNVLNQGEHYKTLSLKELNTRTAPQTWSVLECLEHLNRYGNFYLPEIEQRLQQATKSNTETFKSGWLGNYFAKSMLPKEKLNKMNTFKEMNPLGSQLDKETVNTFIQQQKKILELLQMARQYNLNKVKTGISISKWIKLKLGDTFRVIIYHNQRHMVQGNRVLASI